MKRLPEHFDETNPNEVYAAALLENARPLEPSAARKRRVWMALQRSPMKRPTMRMSGIVIAGLLLCGATAAGASMTHVWMRLRRPSVDIATPSMAAPELAHASRPKARKALTEPTLVPAPPEPFEPAWVEPLPVEPLPAARKQAPSKSRAAVAEQVDPPASAALMVEAMQARRVGNLARARDLSSEYRVKYPSGALQEEALALSIEAAAALGDEEASRLSMLYLQRYPHGRFRTQALRVMGSSR